MHFYSTFQGKYPSLHVQFVHIIAFCVLLIFALNKRGNLGEGGRWRNGVSVPRGGGRGDGNICCYTQHIPVALAKKRMFIHQPLVVSGTEIAKRIHVIRTHGPACFFAHCRISSHFVFADGCARIAKTGAIKGATIYYGRKAPSPLNTFKSKPQKINTHIWSVKNRKKISDLLLQCGIF